MDRLMSGSTAMESVVEDECIAVVFPVGGLVDDGLIVFKRSTDNGFTAESVADGFVAAALVASFGHHLLDPVPCPVDGLMDGGFIACSSAYCLMHRCVY